jgi:hypothetical protein
MSFGLYIFGYVVLIIGLALGAHLAHVPQKWIGSASFAWSGWRSFTA